MALLDFVKNRQQQQAAPQPVAKTAQLAPTQQDVSKVVPASELAKARAVGETLKKASMHIQAGPAAGENGSNAALLQNQNNQDKVQAPMSPTDHFNGRTALQKRAGGWER